MTQRPLANGPPRLDTADEPGCITPAELQELAIGLSGTGRRCLIGMAGPPGAGKSCLAEHLASSLRLSPPVVPMDGFHLQQAVIDEKGMEDRKGSPETFDAWGFASLINRMASPDDDAAVHAPRFDRSIEEPIAGAVRVGPEVGLVIVEGNYLLLEEPPWNRIRPAFDLCAYLDLDDATRVRRLVERHVRYGKSRPEAERFVRESDEKNAQLIKTTRNRADVIVRMEPGTESFGAAGCYG